jgi:UDP-glucose 4-epimerase
MHIGKVDPDPYMLGLRDRKHFLTLCFCCPCCCVAMKDFSYFAPEIRARTYRLEGLEVEVTGECNGCARCVKTCYADAIVMEDGIARVTEGCKGCGLCVLSCPREAITMTIADGNRMVEEALERITRYSDVT